MWRRGVADVSYPTWIQLQQFAIPLYLTSSWRSIGQWLGLGHLSRPKLTSLEQVQLPSDRKWPETHFRGADGAQEEPRTDLGRRHRSGCRALHREATRRDRHALRGCSVFLLDLLLLCQCTCRCVLQWIRLRFDLEKPVRTKNSVPRFDYTSGRSAVTTYLSRLPLAYTSPAAPESDERARLHSGADRRSQLFSRCLQLELCEEVS